MKIVFLFLCALSLSSCSEDEISSVGRAVNGAYSGYYGNRPAYYPQPVTPVVPVAPVVY